MSVQTYNVVISAAPDTQLLVRGPESLIRTPSLQDALERVWRHVAAHKALLVDPVARTQGETAWLVLNPDHVFAVVEGTE